MTSRHLVTGPAGSGKTTWLIEQLKARQNDLRGRRVLAITRMHGARRRVQQTLRDSCPGVDFEVGTIDSVAITLANKWRTVEGRVQRISPVPSEPCKEGSPYGEEATFESVCAMATRLLEASTIRRLIAAQYPLVLVDEFQDCRGSTLEFVGALTECTESLLAADPFQDLNADGACPAYDWAESCQTRGSLTVVTLDSQHRAKTEALVEAARRVRQNEAGTTPCVPVIACESAALVANQIILHFLKANWRGTAALIFATKNDQANERVLASYESQLARKPHLSRVHWKRDISSRLEAERLKAELGIKRPAADYSTPWTAPNGAASPLASLVIRGAERQARLLGHCDVPQRLVERLAERAVQRATAFSMQSPLHLATNVHGAKNLEFDNVILVWTYKLPPSQEQQRRLLYNGITRARKNCAVLVLGNVARASSDPSLRLLGPASSGTPPKRRLK